MNLELKAMLAEGKITQEVFDELSKKLENSDDNNGGKPDGTNEEEIEKRIQSAVDRAMNKAGNEKKKLLEEIERMKKEKMTESERKEYELSEKEKEIINVADGKLDLSHDMIRLIVMNNRSKLYG